MRYLGIEVDDALEISEQTEIRGRRVRPPHQSGRRLRGFGWSAYGAAGASGHYETLGNSSLPVKLGSKAVTTDELETASQSPYDEIGALCCIAGVPCDRSNR